MCFWDNRDYVTITEMMEHHPCHQPFFEGFNLKELPFRHERRARGWTRRFWIVSFSGKSTVLVLSSRTLLAPLRQFTSDVFLFQHIVRIWMEVPVNQALRIAVDVRDGVPLSPSADDVVIVPEPPGLNMLPSTQETIYKQLLPKLLIIITWFYIYCFDKNKINKISKIVTNGQSSADDTLFPSWNIKFWRKAAFILQQRL